MARFSIWIASFLTMTFFWRSMGFAWFFWKDKDFAQVQNENCERLCNSITSLEKCLMDMEVSSKAKVLNKNQCVHLFGKLLLAMKGMHSMLLAATEDLKFQFVFEELCWLQKKVEIVGRLEEVLQTRPSEDYEIAQHLLLKLRNLDRVDGGDLDALEVSNDFKVPVLFKEIGVGSYGHVYHSNWLGMTCATKVLEGNFKFLNSCRKEVGTLAGLSHPNLVQFFGCGINHKMNEANMEEIKRGKSSEMYLVMELMETSLSSILKKANRPLPYHLAIDIMHQIAKGVYFLHDMQVAHLDLKPDNILSSSISMEGLDPYRSFKVTDYGTCQLEVCSHHEDPKPSTRVIGTPGYWAPEVSLEVVKGRRPSSYKFYPFQADAWSFGMICSEILSRKAPSYNASSRADLPNNCEELTNLIEECWAENLLERPTFSNICDKLMSLKKSFWKGTYSWKMVPSFGGSSIIRDSKSVGNMESKKEESVKPLKESVIGVEHQLSKVKELLEMKYIGIFGMGGIGKTTLAMAIFDDVVVKSSYHASCFVAKCKDRSPYEILCAILGELWNGGKPKDLGNAQEMMEEILLSKKVFLILDDVDDEAQVNNVVLPHVVQASKGTTIMITTRDWSTIKAFVRIEGRFDVALLDDEAATSLFLSHLSWDVASLSPDFVNLRKHVVKACNSLPLSLKVMGAFLRTKERLRSWERALQRMARGRNLDGDKEIWNTLNISYDGLNNNVEKGMFLDMACLFCKDIYPLGVSKETMLSMWSNGGFLPVQALERLIDMSLLKVNKRGGILEMHDQLRDMGQMLAEGTRIWKASMIPELGFTTKDHGVVEGISLQAIMKHPLTFVEHDQSIDFENLRVMTLAGTLIKTHEKIEILDFLIPIASHSSNLRAILIDTLTMLKALPKEVENLSSLTTLNLQGCSSLAALPKEVGNLSLLTTLILNGCASLTALPEEVGKLSSLTTLSLEGCLYLAALPMEVGNLSSLTTLNLKQCASLAALPKKMGNLSSLTTLNLKGCSSLVALPKELENLSSLTSLNLPGHRRFVAFPKKMGNLSSLSTLSLKGCRMLAALPKEVGNLSSLTTLNLKGCSSLAALPKEMGNLSSLTTFNLNGCRRLAALPKEIGNLSSLTTLNLKGCSSLAALPKEIGNLSSLATLNLYGCSSLVALHKGVGNLSSLTTLNFIQCARLASLPKEVGNLSSLNILNLKQCARLLALPKGVGNLSSLTTLILRGCSRLAALPKEVGNLSSLTTLNLNRCSRLVALPKEVGNLSSLTTLNLNGCASLAACPEEVGNLSSVITLNLNGCVRLAALPKEVGNLLSLSSLNLKGCSRLVALPKEVGNLSSLTTLNLNGCVRLVALPKEVRNLSFLTTLNLNGCSNLVALPKEVRACLP